MGERAGSVDATSDVPAGRWLIDPAKAFDPRIALADHVYSIRGGFVDAPAVNPDGLDLDRSVLDRLDPLFHLALHVARQAWSDARTERVDRDRVGVVFGNIVLPTETASALSREILGAVFEEAAGRRIVGDRLDRAVERVSGRSAGRPGRAAL